MKARNDLSSAVVQRCPCELHPRNDLFEPVFQRCPCALVMKTRNDLFKPVVPRCPCPLTMKPRNDLFKPVAAAVPLLRLPVPPIHCNKHCVILGPPASWSGMSFLMKSETASLRLIL